MSQQAQWFAVVMALLAILIVLFGWLALPPPPESPRPVSTSTPRVLATTTPPLVFTVPTMTPEPTFAADLLPMATVTLRPTGTRVPETATPTPNLTPAVQRG